LLLARTFVRQRTATKTAHDHYSRMPRFYFDVREGTDFRPDDVGEIAATINAAEHEAAVMAAFHTRNGLPRRAARKVTVEVRNQYGQHVLTATVSLKVERSLPPPISPKA
jgi:hypothetical protein